MIAFLDMIIYPLKFFLQLIFSITCHVFPNSFGISILCLSVAVSLITLPIYIKAEHWQQVEHALQLVLKPSIKRIKSTFTGDEQYMLLSTMYRERHYHPVMALRSSVGLFIMIPFFLAAYSYLSNVKVLSGVSFLCIKDLSKPDTLISIGNIKINALPILMTIFNFLSAIQYLKTYSLKDKIRSWALAILFLFLLYNSPSCLLLYWTMNNFISLVKNLIYNAKNVKKLLYIVLCTTVASCVIYLLFFHTGASKKRFILIVCLLLTLFVPLFIKAVNYILDKYLTPLYNDTKFRTTIFLISMCSIALLSGYVIPASLIGSSVAEFFNIDGLGSPKVFVNVALTQSIGMFILWPSAIYFLFSKKIQTFLCVASIVWLLCSLVNVFIYVGHYGTMSRLLTFAENINNATSIIMNIASLVSMIAICVLIIVLIALNSKTVLLSLSTIILLTQITMGFCYYLKIKQQTKAVNLTESTHEIKPVLHFSKTGRNVILLMLDNAETAFFEDVLLQAPEIKTAMTGFVHYTNTVSYGGHTIFGSPPIFGGYDYTPFNINLRDSEPLIKKHNEALLVLPTILTNIGFKATVADSPWANYTWIPDMSIYNSCPNTTALNLERAFSDEWIKQNPSKIEKNITSRTIKRNLLYMSFFRCITPILREAIYDGGYWWGERNKTGDINEFIDYYSELYYLNSLTDFCDTGDNYFCITNDTTHQDVLLQAPQYDISLHPNNAESTSRFAKYNNFGVNVLAFRKLAAWFTYLKENDCYDNTKIIIVSDHGSGKNSEDVGVPQLENGYQTSHLHSILLVKDFNATGDIKGDNTFMTTADVPALVLKDIADNAVNPYTNCPIKQSQEKASNVIVTTNKNWTPSQQSRTKFNINDTQWYRVQNSVFDKNNYHQLSTNELQALRKNYKKD